MGIKVIILALTTLSLTHSVNAATIVDNGSYTTVNGVDWLDLTATQDMSYNDVKAQMGIGGSLEGWQYATQLQVYSLWNALGGSGSYNGSSTENNGLFATIAPLFGDLACDNPAFTCTTGEGESLWIMADEISPGARYWATSGEDAGDPSNYDYFRISGSGNFDDNAVYTAGSALVRTSTLSAVPIPAAVWLFGSGLLGLVGVARRKKA